MSSFLEKKVKIIIIIIIIVIIIIFKIHIAPLTYKMIKGAENHRAMFSEESRKYIVHAK